MRNAFKTTLSDKILDEISLEGLEGITLSTLWLYLADSMELAAGLPVSLKAEIWQFVKRNSSRLQFFELPTERPVMKKLYKRFEATDDNVYPERRYKMVQIQDKDIMGSCETYKERKEIPFNSIKDLSVDEIQKIYGERFVIVASQDLRFNALFPPSVLIPKDISLHIYCLLEIIGRARYNGEITSGVGSLQDFCKDATLVFYIKNKLVKMGVIVTQTYNELRSGRLVLTTLVRLSRFYTAQQTSLNYVIETVFNALQAHPEHSISFNEIRTLFTADDKITSLKKVIVTHHFRRIFDVKSVDYFDSTDKSKSTSEEGKGRTKIMISLRDPNMCTEDLFTEKTTGDELDDNIEVDKKSVSKMAYTDMLIKDQVYNAIFRQGPRGLSQSEICCYLGLSNLTMRQILKSFVDENLVTIYLQNVGRQRIQMYVAIEFAANVSNYNASVEEIKKLRCDDEPKLPPPPEQSFSDCPDVIATIEPFKYVTKITRDLSNRQISRTGIVIKALNEKCLIPINEILNLISKKETELGYQSIACRKSIRRILNHLVNNGTINMYEVILKVEKEDNMRVHRFVTHPKIHLEHEVIRNEISKLKTAFFFKIEERRLQLESQRQAAELKLRKKEREKSSKDTQQKLPTQSKPLQKREFFHKIPKFLVSRYLHEFLFYIIVELNEYQTPQEITEELVLYWKKSEPSILKNEYMDKLVNEDVGVKAYTKEINWRTFIPPLQKYADKPPGWVYMIDAIERMPLSIFMKIFRLENNLHVSLEEYVSHPIRQHYLINQLPVELNSLINRVYMQKVFLSVLKLLNHMGLIQVNDNINRQDKLMMWVFLNRNASILDTTTSEPSYSQINPSRQYETIRLVFNTFEDVYRYWMTLQRICVYTKLGFRKNIPRKKHRVKELSYIGYVKFDEAPCKDIGYIPGDHLGAGGLSSELFAHVFRYWSWAMTSQTKLKASSSIKKPNQNKVLMLKKAARKKQMFPVTLVKRLIPSHSGSRPSSSSVAIGNKRNRINFRDAIDREALKNMRTLRVTWSAEEDKLLKIARAVYVFLSPPVISLPLVTVSKICRDVIRHTIGIRNKTIQACLRRFHFLVKNNRHLPETPLWINMLQTNNQLTEKYGDSFIMNLKLEYPERNEFCNALTMHFLEIMCFLFKQINNIEEVTGSNFCIPDKITDFEQLYLTRSYAKTDEKFVKYENPATDHDLKVSVVYSLLHSSMCCVRDKTPFTLQAFEIFKHYSEEVLKTAYTKARNDGLAVVLKRKHITSQLATSHLTGPSYLLSSKYRLKLTFLKIPYQIFEAIHNAEQNIFEAIYNTNNSIEGFHNYELKAPHIGQLLTICEGLARNFWLTSIKFPVNILTVDSEQPIFSSDRTLHHYHSILDNAPNIEYIKNFPIENPEKRVRVKFHSANLSYKVYYAPYDEISKLSSRHLHFFCALDHLQQSVELNVAKLQRREDTSLIDCPFNCIMKNENYLNAIERIVHEKKEVLNELQDISAQKPLAQIGTTNSIKIQPSNLFAIVRILEKAWQEKEELIDLKDFGKKLLEIKGKKSIDWLKICKNILEYNEEDYDIDKTDEYEPMLTKEDRFRDAFMINLPTIGLEPSNLLNSVEKVRYNSWLLPKYLILSDTQREDVLDKIKRDSLWTYTDDNLNTLKPKLEALQLSSMEQKHIEEIHDFIAGEKFGVSFKELLQEFPYKNFLNKALIFLIKNFLIKRVGVAVHVYVHKCHLREWVVHTFHISRRDQENLKAKRSFQDRDGPSSSNKRLKRDTECQEDFVEKEEQVLEDKAQDALKLLKERDVIVLRPRPWIRLNGSLNRRVLDRWLGSLLSECTSRFGCFVPDLCAHFQNMYPADIHFLLEILSDIKCICLKETRIEQVDMFSDYKDIEEEIVHEITDPVCTFTTVLPDALTQMAHFIGDKKYNSEFV